MIKRLSEVSFDDLLFNKSFYEKVEVVWNDYVTEKISYYNEAKEDGYEVYYTKDFQILIDFISKEHSVYGNCPNCNKSMSFHLHKNNMDSELLDRCIESYSQSQLDCDAIIFDKDIVMLERIRKLTESGGAFIKLVECHICKKFYSIVFVITKELTQDGIKLYLQKTGQFPSIREFSDYNAKEYKSILKKAKADRDFDKGQSAYIDGYYAGAYVYLRRVFEKFLYYKYDEVKANLQITFEDFKKAKNEDKIDKLKLYLPPFVKNNTVFYSVISAGVHALSEEECKDYFPIINQAIEVILYQELANKKLKLLEQETSTGLNQTNSAIKSNKV